MGEKTPAKNTPVARRVVSFSGMKWVLLSVVFFQFSGPSLAASPPPADTARLRQHLRFLTTTLQPRSYQHPAVLDSVAAYIQRQLRAAGAHAVGAQPYAVRGQT